MKYPLISPVSTYDEYIEEEPTVIGYTVSTNRRNDKSMNLSKLDELNQVGKDSASSHFLNNSKKLIFFQIANVRTAEEKVEPRYFLFYWYTTTITTTKTTYTKTTTFTLQGCSPASFAYSLCGWKTEKIKSRDKNCVVCYFLRWNFSRFCETSRWSLVLLLLLRYGLSPHKASSWISKLVWSVWCSWLLPFEKWIHLELIFCSC